MPAESAHADVADDYLRRVRESLVDDPAGQVEFEDALARDRLLVQLIEARGGTTQSVVAHRMGTTQSAVSDLEKGRVDPRQSTLRRYARAVGRRLHIDLVEPEAISRSYSAPATAAESLQDTLLVGEDVSRAKVLTAFYTHEQTSGPRSLDEIAELTNLPGSAVGYMISQLHRAGWLTQSLVHDDHIARFKLRDDRGLMVGVHLRADGVHGIITDLRAQQIFQDDFEPLDTGDLQSLVARVDVLVTRMRTALRNGEGEVLGLGVTLAGLVEEDTGIVRFAPDLPELTPGWDGSHAIAPRSVELEGALEARTGLRTVVSNDASALALHEYLRRGEDQNVALVLLSRSGDGVGGGFVINREMARGLNGVSGEIGHVVVDPGGDACRCGPNVRGCLETVASPAAIVRRVAEAHPEVSSLAEVADLAERRDETAIQTLKDAGSALGQVLATLVALVGPHRLVVLGPPELVDEEFNAARLFLEQVKLVPLPFGLKLDPVPKVLDERDEPRAAAAAAVGHFLARPRRWIPSIAPVRWTALQQDPSTTTMFLEETGPQIPQDPPSTSSEWTGSRHR